VESEDVARRLERELGGCMQMIFLEKKEMKHDLETIIPETCDPTQIVALDEKRWLDGVCPDAIQTNANFQKTLSISNSTEAAARKNGGLGYAVNLIFFEQDHELLRRKVFYPLLRTSLVFGSKEGMEAFKEANPNNRDELIPLDGDTFGSTGVQVRGGANNHCVRFCGRNDFNPSSGNVQEASEDFLDVRVQERKHLLQTFASKTRQVEQINQSMLDTEEEVRKSKESVDSLRVEIAKDNDSITTFMQQINKKMEKLANVTQACDTLTSSQQPPSKKMRVQ